MRRAAICFAPAFRFSFNYRADIMRRSNAGRYTTDEESITSEYIRNRIRYLDPDLSHSDRKQADDVDILRRRMDATVLLIKALGGGWDISQLPTVSELRK